MYVNNNSNNMSLKNILLVLEKTLFIGIEMALVISSIVFNYLKVLEILTCCPSTVARSILC
jgi:hypothetical protein